MAHAGEYLDASARLLLSEDEHIYRNAAMEQLASGFIRVWDDDHGRPITDLLRVVMHMSDFVAILESYLDGRPSGRSSATLMDQNNFTHHALMSLPSAKGFAKATGNFSDELYEPCRLGCMIFSLLVIFPIPLTWPLCNKIIAQSLRHLLVVELASRRGRAGGELAVWILTMDAIFAVGLPERNAFITSLTKVLDQLEINGMRSFNMLLAGFLWHPRTNDIDGIGVWRDVQLQRKHSIAGNDNTVQIAERAVVPVLEMRASR